LMAQEHLFAVFERVDHYGPGVTKLDLEDGLVVLAPPFLASSGVVLAELQQMAKDGNRAWNLRQPLDMRDISGKGDLFLVRTPVTRELAAIGSRLTLYNT